jgi:hypothetical protein
MTVNAFPKERRQVTPARNRVTPMGEIEAIPLRGAQIDDTARE